MPPVGEMATPEPTVSTSERMLHTTSRITQPTQAMRTSVLDSSTRKSSSLSIQPLIASRRSTVSTDCESTASGLATPPTATFWMCGVFEPRIETILLA